MDANVIFDAEACAVPVGGAGSLAKNSDLLRAPEPVLRSPRRGSVVEGLAHPDSSAKRPEGFLEKNIFAPFKPSGRCITSIK